MHYLIMEEGEKTTNTVKISAAIILFISKPFINLIINMVDISRVNKKNLK